MPLFGSPSSALGAAATSSGGPAGSLAECGAVAAKEVIKTKLVEAIKQLQVSNVYSICILLVYKCEQF